ncbi:MAG: hypothetical protein AAF585_03330 [Verrucomicrobiota bacterium]
MHLGVPDFAASASENVSGNVEKQERTMLTVTLCIVGRGIGFALGQGVIYWLCDAMIGSEPPTYAVFGAVAGFTANVKIGMLAGLYPAVRTSRLD